MILPMNKYKAVLFAPDGDYVIDFYESESIEDVVNKLNDMGSRWFFYPIECVIPDNTTKTLNNRIVETGIHFEFMKGKSVKTASQFLKDNPEFINDFI